MADKIDRSIRETVDSIIKPRQKKRRQSKKEREAEALRASDVTAELMGRDDVQYGSHTELPAGPNVATLDAVGPKVSEGRGKVSWQTFVRGIRQKGDKTR